MRLIYCYLPTKFFIFLNFFYFITIFANDYPKLLIKIPTRSRPEQFFKTLDKYYENLSGNFPYHFLITCDTNDTTMHNQEVIKKLKSYHNLSYRFAWHTSKIAAYNSFIDEFLDQCDILIVTSDDMVPIMKNFDQIIVQKMLEYFPDLDGVLNFSDGRDNMAFNTYPIMGIFYYLRFGYVYNPAYKSFFCDNELAEVSRMLDKEELFREVLFSHDIKFDALFRKNFKNWDADETLYWQRKQKNFDV